ncbi:MAG TPA: M24 family metallopeptidase [bacterium]|nr:M24 family metallopeptidase [bacterium]HQL63148.1 M24 family metallopeptidase [bacterium]
MPVEQSRRDEFAEKLLKIRRIIESLGLDGLLLTEQSTIAWLTGGAETFIMFASVESCGPLLVTQDSVHLICSSIETSRLLEEEFPGLDLADLHYPWHKGYRALKTRIEDIVGRGKWVSEADPIVRNHILECYSVLTEAEQDRYRWIGGRSEEAVRAACLSIKKGMSEFEIAGILSAEAHKREIWPVLILVAADERLRKYRHPIPTANRVEHCVMLVLCARRWGLIANLTRLVHFGPVPDDLAQKHKAVCTVDATFIHETRPGVSYGEIFRKGQACYAQQGFADEWQSHHQGGPSGYLGRLFTATPDSKELVHEAQAVAWNPSIAGTKSEDTLLVHAKRVEFLTAARNWPMLEISVGGKAYERPDILVRS